MNKKKKAIIGFGITGQSVCRYFLIQGFKVVVFDSKSEAEFDQNILKNFNDVEFKFATNDFDVTDFDLIVASPGVPLTIPVLQKAKEKGIPIKTDVTLFIEKWRDIGPIVGVTGSNGKTTIVNLIFNYLKEINVPAILAGNVGNSPLDDLGKHQKGTIAVLELSSYQLEHFNSEHYLDVCLISNLSSNHLDRYNGQMTEYGKAKMMGIDNQKTKTVVCLDDPGTKNYILPQLKAKNITLVSLETQSNDGLKDGIYSDEDGNLVLKNQKETKIIFTDTNNRKLIGLHNLYNIALSFGVLNYLGVDLTNQNFFREFIGLEHRIEFVAEFDGIKYINDSKSTSPDSTRAALEAITKTKNVLLIMGGKDKGMDYHLLCPFIEQYVKGIILLPGSSSSKITQTFRDLNLDILESIDLEGAVSLAKKNVSSGDIILLSPAAASPQPYKNFEERGKHFKELVNSLK